MEVWGGNQAVDCGVVMSGLDAWLYSRPLHAERGGDVHYVSSCATGKITRMLVADVSGHGAAVADTASRLRLLMRQHVNRVDQTRFVSAINREFLALPDRGGFATSVVGTFFAPTNRLVLSNAGHPPPILYRKREGAWSFVEPPAPHVDAAGDIPLGILEESPYGERAVQLRVGDLVLCYTDSLIEARDEAGQLLGRDGLLRIVQKLDASRPDALIAALLEAIAARNPSNLAGDDVTVLVFRPNGLFPRAPLSRSLAAPFRLMGAIFKRLAGSSDPIPWPEFSLPGLRRSK
jgi:serine phosphatase RsbU (regulator of sigma subunit)